MISWIEILTAIITSLVAAIVFWIFTECLPKRIARKKLAQLIDFDLYQLYMKFFFFFECMFRPSPTHTSFMQDKILTGNLSNSDFDIYLSTKCLTNDYCKVDGYANNLLPIGNELKNTVDEIQTIIRDLYAFNHYLTAEQIMMCRKIMDKLSMYSYDMSPFTNVGETVFCVVDPTLRTYSSGFIEMYQLFLQLQEHLFSIRPNDSKSGDFYSKIKLEKCRFLYYHAEYKKVIRFVKKDKSRKYYAFMSYYQMNKIEKTKASIKEYLGNNKERLICLRSFFGQMLNDNEICNLLIKERSKQEFDEMLSCINREEQESKQYYNFALRLKEHYDERLRLN